MVIAISKNTSISEFDGKSPAVGECLFCNLAYHKEMSTDKKLCKSCFRLLYVSRISEGLGKYSLPALITGILIWFFFKEFISLLFPLSIFVIVPVLLSGFLLPYIIYYQIPEEQTLAHKMRMREKIGESRFLESVENYLSKDQPSKIVEEIILQEFTSQVLLSHKPNPPKILEKWSEFFDLSVTQFVERLLHETDLMDGFTPFSGVGVLPDVWPHVESEEIRSEIMDKLAEGCEMLEEAATTEKKYFLEDLYLLEDEIYELAETKDKWEIICLTLDEFEPDEVPKGTLQSLMAQANENARMMEHEKMMKNRQSSKSPSDTDNNR